MFRHRGLSLSLVRRKRSKAPEVHLMGGRPQKDYHALWQDRIAQLEACSGAEVVVATQAQAESYQDVDWKWACLISALSLLFMVHSPVVFHPDWVWLNTMLAGLLGLLASRKLPGLRRLLTSSRRRRQQLERSAVLAFERLKISHTRQRTGLLLLVSWFEQEAILVPDLGLTAHLPRAVLNQLQVRLDQASSQEQLKQAVSEVLEQLGEPLQQFVPRCIDDADELSNQVRVL